MPRLPEARKDAASCENARGTASRYRSVRCVSEWGNPAGRRPVTLKRVGERGELKHLSTRRRRKKTSMAPVAASEEAGAQTVPVEAGAG